MSRQQTGEIPLSNRRSARRSSDKQRLNWQSPEAVHRHFFAADKAPAAPDVARIIKKLVAAMDGKAPAEREHVVKRVREALIETALEEAA